MNKDFKKQNKLIDRTYNSWFIDNDRKFFIYCGDPNGGYFQTKEEYHLISIDGLKSLKKEKTLEDILFFYKFELRKEKIEKFLNEN